MLLGGGLRSPSAFLVIIVIIIIISSSSGSSIITCWTETLHGKSIKL